MPSNTLVPLTKTPWTPRGSRIVRGPAPGRSLTRRDAEMPTVAGSTSSRSAQARGRDPAAIGDAVKPGLMADQAAHPLGEIERTSFAHPMTEEVEPKPTIAQIGEMRAGVGQRDHRGLVLDQWLDAGIDRIEEAADKPGYL